MAFPQCINMPGSHLICQVVDIIESEYDAGLVVHVEQLYGGYTNLSFAVSTYRAGRIRKLFFRKYWLGVTAGVIQFEHALLSHAISRGAHCIAGVIRTEDGRGFVRRDEGAGDSGRTYYYAAFDFIEGFDKYSWVNNRLNDSEYGSAGAVLAALHSATSDFEGEGLVLPRETVLQVVPRLTRLFADCGSRASGCCYGRFFVNVVDEILLEARRVEGGLSRLPVLPVIGVHGDYHPGNQKYADDRVVGIFDFDRANIDLRVYDVALAVIYFCCNWGGAADGHLRLDKMALFLLKYQRSARRRAGLGPMSDVELECFPVVLAAANLVLVKWASADTFFAGGSTCDSSEYLSYLRHHVELMYWLRRNGDALSLCLESLSSANGS